MALLQLISYAYVSFLVYCAKSKCTMPINVQYGESAYNIMKGNPHAIGTQFDKGFSHARIFDFGCYDGSDVWKAPDGEIYAMPNGSTIVGVSSCSMVSSYTEISGLQSYTKQLYQSVSVTADSKGLDYKASFSASVEYSNVAKQTIQQNTIVVSTEFKCGYYHLSLDTPYNGPNFDQNFIIYIENMPLNYSDDPDYFYKFINDDYGTHFLTSITFGGRYGQNSQFTDYNYSSFSSSNLDISQTSSYSTLDYGGSESSMTNISKSQANDFNKATESRNQFYVGGQLPANGTAAAWQESISTAPMPMEYTLESIENLLVPQMFPNISVDDLKKKQDALYEALTYYCSQIASNYSFIYCAGLPPDLGLPNTSIFGGIYDYAGQNYEKYSIQNPYTQQFNCKASEYGKFEAFTISNFGICDANNNLIMNNPVKMNLCLNITKKNNVGVYQDGMNYFGGMFSTSCYSWPEYPNPFTNNITCEKGFIKQHIGSYVSTKGDYACSLNKLYYCYNGTTSIKYSILGGFYQQSSVSAYNIDNQYTKTQSCPDNFTPFQMANLAVYYDNDVNNNCVDGTIWMCLNNVYE